MNTGDTLTPQQFVQELYEFLRNYIDGPTLLLYSTRYPYSRKNESMEGGFLNSAFKWADTYGGFDHWASISNFQPDHLSNSYKVGLTLQQLIDAILSLYKDEQQQSYEYW